MMFWCLIIMERKKMALYQATIDDKPYIMALYTEAIGSEGCTWNEDYPSEETMDSDLARGDAYVWKDETGELLGAISIDDDHVVEELPEDRRLPEK